MKLRERKLSLADMLAVLKKSCLLILACALVGAAAGWLYAARQVTESFTAVSSVYVQTVSADLDAGATANDTALGRAMATNCREVMLNNRLAENVRRYFAERRADSPDEGWENIDSYSDARILGMITVAVETNSQTLVISVTAPTASLACHLANAVAGETEVSVVDIIGNCLVLPNAAATSAIRTRVDQRRSTAVLGAVGFGAAAYAVLLVLHFINRRVRTAGEAEEDYAPILPHLGTLPKRK